MKDAPAMSKGAILEEVLRAYFLRNGFFVIRGVPFRFAGEDLTDVDLWLYEHPTGAFRRIQICDIKYKQRPKAVERFFWTSGLATALEVDGAYVATTDKRPTLRPIAEKLGLQLIDGTDIQRILGDDKISYEDRIDDESLISELQAVDAIFRDKYFQYSRQDILSSLSEGFGAASTVRALEAFSRLTTAIISYPPDSSAARAAGRLAYLAAAITCASLDYVSVGAPFRTVGERRKLMLDAVRLGALSNDVGNQTLRMAVAFVEKYAPGGKATAATLEANLRKDLEGIPAEIIADQAVRLVIDDKLFTTACELEKAAYSLTLPVFDKLTTSVKSMLGALLDYAGVDRARFATAWKYIDQEYSTNGNKQDLLKKEPSKTTLL